MTLFPLIFSFDAAQDVTLAQERYELARVGLGNQFLLRIEEICDAIRQTPGMYAVLYRGVRGCRVKQFPYIFYYRVELNTIVVVAVVHASRHPNSWKQRV